MKNYTDDEIEELFNEKIGNMSNKEFDGFIKSWFDEQHYLDIIADWDTGIKRDWLIEWGILK